MQERTKTIEVPPNTGVEGFIHVVRQVVQQPRVQKLMVDKVGRVSYTQLVSADAEEDNLNVSFEHLQPYYIVRNSRVQELSFPADTRPMAAVATMLDVLCSKGYAPIAFVASPSTTLWSWLYFGDDLEVSSRDTFLGYPLYTDKQIPDSALVLCAGVEGASALIDTKVSLKIEMQRIKHSIQDEEVEIT
jgi:hypothetical protein